MSEANQIIVYQARVEELQTKVNKLSADYNMLNKMFEEVFALAKIYVPNEKMAVLMDKWLGSS